MLTLQFIPLCAAPVMGRLMRSLKHPDTMAVLDLEDGHWDLEDPARTEQRKAEARRLLLELCALNRGRNADQPVAIRLNLLGTEEFKRDLPVARAVAGAFKLAMVLQPKIKAPDDLLAARAALAEEGVEYDGLVPMVETERGMERIQDIVAAAQEMSAPGVLYGYHDYCLDAGHWPFLDLGERAFWDVVARVAAPTLAAGLRYMHPPQVDLHDEERLGALITRLRDLCGSRFDILSAGMSQTPLLRALGARPAQDAAALPPLRERPALGLEEKRTLAREICALFESNRRAEHSFSADSRSGRFIPPHEYLAAVRCLQGVGSA